MSAGTCLVAERVPPAPDDLLVRPAVGHVRVEAHEQMQLIVPHREAAHADGEKFHKFLQAIFDPFPAAHRPFAQQERASERKFRPYRPRC